uniref:Uncharacterized protein n=1 Tax=Chloropicon primus TaxID=1764295 RepID=A0A7S2T5B3_9CHLO|mmetsp:Transcript_5584/g.16972  ORF Transcript_5584/g.16972 Transcript_5584/m.16972 type:complete len:109 (+) Transcript_5584:167-493(+)
MVEIGSTGVSFTKVAREWRCKYAMGKDGGPGTSEALTRAQALLNEYLPQLKGLAGAEVTRIVCGGCADFKVIVNQPAADHDTWKAKGYAPEEGEGVRRRGGTLKEGEE